MSEKREIILSGTGGQGLILAGQILAEAAVLDGKNTAQTQSYGPEARGGASRSEVIISDGEIDYPKVTCPDVLLAMSQEALNKYSPLVGPGGTIIVDITYIEEMPRTLARVVALPCSRMAKENLGREVVANIVALAALVAITGAVSKESLEEALLNRIPKGTEELNKRALELGWKSACQTVA